MLYVFTVLIIEQKHFYLNNYSKKELFQIQ